MPHIESTIVIRAGMPRVFDLISRPQEFAKCSEHILQVVSLGKGRHHWDVRVAGITLGWDSDTTEYRRPEYLAWRSITGIENSGSYCLARTKRGTAVTLEMDYHLPSTMLDEVAGPLSEPIVEEAAAQVLECVKAWLENDPESNRRPPDDGQHRAATIG